MKSTSYHVIVASVGNKNLQAFRSKSVMISSHLHVYHLQFLETDFFRAPYNQGFYLFSSTEFIFIDKNIIIYKNVDDKVNAGNK